MSEMDEVVRPGVARSQAGHTRQAKAVPHLPGEAGIWVLILGDMVVFSLFFGTYLYYRADDVALFNQSQHALNRNFGAINTFLLLTSSWFIAMAVQFARSGRGREVTRLIGAAMACGGGFAVIKVLEYHEKIAAGIMIATNQFFMFYFILTGVHFLHLTLGMGFLTYLWVRSRTALWTQKDIAVLEIGATFWHLVDLLWIVLFPLLYLVR